MATVSPVQGSGTKQIFSSEQIRNISSLGDILRQIRARLKSEGISIEEARKRLLNNDQDMSNV